MARESKLACPHAEVPIPSIQHTIHKEPRAGLLAIAGTKSTEVEMQPSRDMTGVNAVEGLDWQPLCRGYSREPHCAELRDQSPKAICEYTTF